jgi:hypothetical protein
MISGQYCILVKDNVGTFKLLLLGIVEHIVVKYLIGVQ